MYFDMKESLIRAYQRRTVGSPADKNKMLEKHDNEIVDAMDMLGPDSGTFPVPKDRGQ